MCNSNKLNGRKHECWNLLLAGRKDRGIEEIIHEREKNENIVNIKAYKLFVTVLGAPSL